MESMLGDEENGRQADKTQTRRTSNHDFQPPGRPRLGFGLGFREVALLLHKYRHADAGTPPNKRRTRATVRPPGVPCRQIEDDQILSVRGQTRSHHGGRTRYFHARAAISGDSSGPNAG